MLKLVLIICAVALVFAAIWPSSTPTAKTATVAPVEAVASKTEAVAVPAPPPSQDDKSMALAALLNESLQSSKSDVTVIGAGDTLIIDCTKTLDPRSVCYQLYKEFPNSTNEVEMLRAFGIKTLKFDIAKGVFSGYEWEKAI